MTTFCKFLTKADLLLLLLLLGAGIFLTAAVYLPQPDHGGVLEVRQNGTRVMTLPLDKPASHTIGDAGNENHFTVQDGIVTMTHASCHDQTCVRTKGIRSPGQSIVCLPHRLVLTIVAADSSDPSLDAVVR